MYLLSYHKTKESQPNFQKIPTFTKLKRPLKELFDPNFFSFLLEKPVIVDVSSKEKEVYLCII